MLFLPQNHKFLILFIIFFKDNFALSSGTVIKKTPNHQPIKCGMIRVHQGVVPLVWRRVFSDHQLNISTFIASTRFLLFNSTQVIGNAAKFPSLSVVYTCSVGTPAQTCPLPTNKLSLKKPVAWSDIGTAHPRREAERDWTLPLCHQAFPNVLYAIFVQRILRKDWEHWTEFSENGLTYGPLCVTSARRAT